MRLACEEARKNVNNASNQGADQARRELLTSLDSIENFTLEGAIN